MQEDNALSLIQPAFLTSSLLLPQDAPHRGDYRSLLPCLASYLLGLSSLHLQELSCPNSRGSQMVGHHTYLPEDWPRTWNLTCTPSLAAGNLECGSRACTISVLWFSSKGSHPTLIIQRTFEVLCKLPEAASCDHVTFQRLLPRICITFPLILSKFNFYAPFKLILSTNLPHLWNFRDALLYAHLLLCVTKGIHRVLN